MKVQRDKYMAFALAAADLLIETDRDRTVISVAGAVRSLLQQTEDEVIGQAVENLFHGAEIAYVRELLIRCADFGRIEPTPINLRPDQGQSRALVGATFLSAMGRHFVTLTILPRVQALGDGERDPATGLMSRRVFQQIAAGTLSPWDANSGAVMLRELSFLRVTGLPAQLERLPAAKAQQVMTEIAAFLRAQASEGGAATRLDDDKFGLIMRPGQGAELSGALNRKIARALAEVGAANGIKASVTTLSLQGLGLGLGLSGEALDRALTATMDAFVKTGKLAPEALETTAAGVRAEQVSSERFRHRLAEGDVPVAFQPAIRVADGQAVLFEIMLGEDDGAPGMAARGGDFDGVVAAYLLDKAGQAVRAHPNSRIYLCVPSKVISDEAGRDLLHRALTRHRGVAGELCLVVTRLDEVVDTRAFVAGIEGLRKKSVMIGLDEDGEGRSLSLLRRITVDLMRLGAEYLASAEHSDREASLLKGQLELARAFKIKTLADASDRRSTPDYARSLGVDLMQGRLLHSALSAIPAAAVSRSRPDAHEVWL